ncbi:MAG: flippase-like domain-containing protein [Candidatus Methanofastidiosia archaeon]|jgi:uncharacterized protein (TIRG00374 family)
MSTQQDIPKQQKVEKKTLILLGLGIVVLVLIVKLVGTSEIVPVLADMDYQYIVLIISFQALMLGTWNLRWNLFVNKLHPVNYFSILPIFMAGLLINNLTPGPSLGGQPITAYYLAKKTKKAFSECFATLVLDMSMHSLAFISFALFSIAYVFLFIPIHAIRVFIEILVLIILVIIGVAIIFWRFRNQKMQSNVDWFLKRVYRLKILSRFMARFTSYADLKEYIHEQFRNLKKTVKNLFKVKKLVGVTFVLALFLHMFEYLKVHTVFVSLGYAIPFTHVVVVTTIGSIIGYFIFLPGGTGAVEASMIAMYFELGIPLGVAATATLLSRLFFYSATYGFGYISLSYLNLKDSKEEGTELVDNPSLME